LDFAVLFYEEKTGHYIIDKLFLPKIIEKMPNFTINDLTSLLMKITKRNAFDYNLVIELEPLINLHLPNISNFKQFLALVKFCASYQVMNPEIFRFIEAKFVWLILNKEQLAINDWKLMFIKLNKLISFGKLKSHLFNCVYLETYNDFEKYYSQENEQKLNSELYPKYSKQKLTDLNIEVEEKVTVEKDSQANLGTEEEISNNPEEENETVIANQFDDEEFVTSSEIEKEMEEDQPVDNIPEDKKKV
jgi:hypothetical protein